MFEKIKIGLSVAVILFAMCSIGLSQEDVTLKRSIQIAKRGEKVECESCKTLNEDNAKFCRKCGIDLEKKKKEQRDIKCNKCGTTNSPDSKFCIECGTSLILETELKVEKSPMKEVIGEAKQRKVGFKVGAFQPKDDHLHRLKSNWNVIGGEIDILSHGCSKIALGVEYKEMMRYYEDEDDVKKIDLKNTSIFLTYKIVENKKEKKFIPYLGSGVGYHMIRGETGIYDSGWETKSETEKEMGFHILGGIEFFRNPYNTYVELRYNSVRRLTYFRELEDFEKDIKLSGITLVVGVKF